MLQNHRNYRNMNIEEDDQGQMCLACGDKCPGFAIHEWRHVCSECQCPREKHAISNTEIIDVQDRLGWDRDEDPIKNTQKERTRQLGYTWVPPGLSDDKIEEYMDQLPNHKIPKPGNPGEKDREIQLILQLPKQDLSPVYCKQLNDDIVKTAFEQFTEIRDITALGIASVQDYLKEDKNCVKCDGEIEAGDMGVVAPKAGDDKCWHPACFVCATCDELLVDLVYCCRDDRLYCERHYAELLRPRCGGCDELIFSGEYTKAMDEDFHQGHFACIKCEKSLTGHRYILREEKPYCIVCYEATFANTCEECKATIGTDSKDLSYKEKHWHEKCFHCSKCDVSLVDQPFASKNEKLFCAECHDQNFAARCDGCGDIFRAGKKKFEHKGKHWHEECFRCKQCDEPIGQKRFVPMEKEVVCMPCYEEHFADKCKACGKVINKGGVTYKEAPWHRECFTCTNCQSQLAGEKFTSRDEKPYCANCFGELFAKKCCRCTAPITGFTGEGLGGTKFISFEERHWHSDCFVCYRCNISLVGKGFLTDSEEILCPECGRN